jgi:hypothetical protein
MPEPSTSPGDPISSMGEAAVTLHEMFVSLVEGGFTEDQALRLLAYRLAADGDDAV